MTDVNEDDSDDRGIYARGLGGEFRLPESNAKDIGPSLKYLIVALSLGLFLIMLAHAIAIVIQVIK